MTSKMRSSFSLFASLFLFPTLIQHTSQSNDGFCSASSSSDVDCPGSAPFANPRDPARLKHIYDPELNKLDQEDPALIKFIQDHVLIPPPAEGTPLVLPDRVAYTSSGSINGQYGQPLVVDQIFNHSKSDGFFVEAGAFNGFDLSNSLYFERRYGWTGLLVEPNREAVIKLLEMNRNAWVFPSCFSTKKTPEIVTFDLLGLLGGIRNEAGEALVKNDDVAFPHGQGHGRQDVEVQCFPLYSVFKAMGNPTVDYMTLDIEGAEFNVLSTVPFDKVNINLLDIEMNHAGSVFEGSRMDIRKILFNNGFRFHSRINIDEIFVKKQLFRNDVAE